MMRTVISQIYLDWEWKGWRLNSFVEDVARYDVVARQKDYPRIEYYNRHQIQLAPSKKRESKFWNDLHLYSI